MVLGSFSQNSSPVVFKPGAKMTGLSFSLSLLRKTSTFEDYGRKNKKQEREGPLEN